MHNARVCRFVYRRQDYDQELESYQDPVLSQTLPALLHAADNADGALRGPALSDAG